MTRTTTMLLATAALAGTGNMIQTFNSRVAANLRKPQTVDGKTYSEVCTDHEKQIIESLTACTTYCLNAHALDDNPHRRPGNWMILQVADKVRLGQVRTNDPDKVVPGKTISIPLRRFANLVASGHAKRV